MRRLLLIPLLLAIFVNTAYAATALQVKDAWIQEAPPGATVLAAYLVIVNTGTRAQTLVSVTSPDFAAVEIHTSQVVNGTASMTQLKELTIPPQGQQVFAPGASHLMLMQPKRTLRAGDVAHLRLHFHGATRLDITAKVIRAPPDTEHHH